MLVTFSCDAHENITMFGKDAIAFIKLMGHSGKVPSAILAADIPEALLRLKKAVAAHSKKEESSYDNEGNEDEQVNIATRAWPLVQLLENASKSECNVMWS